MGAGVLRAVYGRFEGLELEVWDGGRVFYADSGQGEHLFGAGVLRY